MKRFIVLYMAPASVMEEWMKSAPETRKESEEKMQREWKEWMLAHQDLFDGITAGVGATKLITSEDVSDTINNIMLYSVVKGESLEDVTKIFKSHPHFGIPEATIQISPINPLPGMG